MKKSEILNSDAERAILRKGFSAGKMRVFHDLRKDGFYLGPEWISDVKRDNPDWRNDACFVRYADDLAAGRDKRPRSRPKLHEVDTPWIIIAEWEYTVILKYLRRLSHRKRLTAWVVRHHLPLDPTAPAHQLAAEITIARRSLPIGWRALQNRVSAFRKKWHVPPPTQRGTSDLIATTPCA